MKAYMPAFWALPNMYLTAAAAAGSIGLINSVGNLGGFLGPTVVGKVKTLTGSYDIGLYFLATTCIISSAVVFAMPALHRRWSELKGVRSRVQALGALALVAVALSLGIAWWVNERLKPWGMTRADVAAATVQDDRYVVLLADSMNDWFDKKPRIRDALVFRLDELKASCEQLVKTPRKQIRDPEQAKAVRSVLSDCIEKIGELKKGLTEKNKDNDNRYYVTVANGLATADQIVRDTQAALLQIAQ